MGQPATIWTIRFPSPRAGDKPPPEGSETAVTIGQLNTGSENVRLFGCNGGKAAAAYWAAEAAAGVWDDYFRVLDEVLHAGPEGEPWSADVVDTAARRYIMSGGMSRSPAFRAIARTIGYWRALNEAIGAVPKPSHALGCPRPVNAYCEYPTCVEEGHCDAGPYPGSSAALLPCPFCDNPTPRRPAQILGRWLIECGIPCGAAVRDYATVADAKMAWNRRAFHWTEVRSAEEMAGFFASRIVAIREAAKRCGYAIGVHGSLRRDLDLIAAPWVTDHSTADALARAIHRAACGLESKSYHWTPKPAGRVATSFPICWTADEMGHDTPNLGCIDLSIAPSIKETAP